MTTGEKHLEKYLDGLDAFVDGRGFDKKHEAARQFVVRACHAYSIIEQLARMTTPTDGITDEDEASDVMADLDDEQLCDAASTLYQLIRDAREIMITPDRSQRSQTKGDQAMPKFEVRFSALIDAFARVEVEADTPEDAVKIARQRIDVGIDAYFELSDNGIDPIIGTIEPLTVENEEGEEVLAFPFTAASAIAKLIEETAKGEAK